MGFQQHTKFQRNPSRRFRVTKKGCARACSCASPLTLEKVWLIGYYYLAHNSRGSLFFEITLVKNVPLESHLGTRHFMSSLIFLTYHS